MSALVHLNPSLQQELSIEHGVTISGFNKTSFVIKFDGIPSAVREARKVINDFLSKAIITNIQYAFSQTLLLIAQKQLKAEQCKVYLRISDGTDDMIVTVCSFDEEHHSVATTLLNRKAPVIEEIIIPSLTISSDSFISFLQQINQLEDSLCVLIKDQKQQDISVHSKQIVITGFCPFRVKNAHSSIHSLLKPYLEHHIKLECKPEEVIYLCKVDKESESILSDLPVKFNIEGTEIVVTGNLDCIALSKESIFNGPLLHLQFKSFPFECTRNNNIMFISLIKDYILEPFSDENKIQYYIEKYEDGDGDIPSDSEVEKFQIIIYSKDKCAFRKICCQMEVVTPKTQLFQLYCEEAVQFVRKAKNMFEEKYRVCVILDDSTCELTVHGLTSDEIQQCWVQIDDDVKLNVDTTKKISLKRYECTYLQKKHTTAKLKQTFHCEITFSRDRESESVYIQGKIKDVKSAVRKIDSIQMIKFNIQCKLSLINMWSMWWCDVIKQQQEKHDVIIQFDHDITGSSKHGSSIIQAVFEIIGTDMDVLKCIKSTLCDEETEERVINASKINKSAFLDVKNLPLFSTLPIAIADINQWSNTITVVSPISLSSNLDKAEEEILKYFELHADVSKEITFEDDPIFRLIFVSPVMLNNYVEIFKDIAEPEKVEVQLKQAKLKLTGNPLAVEKVESLICERLKEEINSTLYPVSSNHITLLATNDFLHFESELQNNYCTTLSYTKPRCSNKVLHVKEIQSPRFAHCLQLSICYGSIVHEEVDAIVNPTITRILSMSVV